MRSRLAYLKDPFAQYYPRGERGQGQPPGIRPPFQALPPAVSGCREDIPILTPLWHFRLESGRFAPRQCAGESSLLALEPEPVQNRSIRLSPRHKDIVRKELCKMLDAAIVTE